MIRRLALLTLLLVPAAAVAAEQGMLIRKDSLRQEPFIDAAEVQPLDANAAVTVMERKGGWMQVDAAGRTGWVRMLNVRLSAGSGGGGGSSLLAASSMFRTGSSGSTVTTGVKGLGEGDLRAAQPNFNELAALDAMAVTPADASAQAAQNKLAANEVEYLKAGRAPGRRR